jgi:activator of 2-hydroxyglutaryl-CoA dehydratase
MDVQELEEIVDTYCTPLEQQLVIDVTSERKTEYQFIGQGGTCNNQDFAKVENRTMLETSLRLRKR